jgi:hypothetical protein
MTKTRTQFGVKAIYYNKIEFERKASNANGCIDEGSRPVEGVQQGTDKRRVSS